MPEPRYKKGDEVVTKESIAIYTSKGKASGRALVGWRWTVYEVITHTKRSGTTYSYRLHDDHGMYQAIIHEDGIWKPYKDLTEEQKATAKAGKEIRVK